MNIIENSVDVVFFQAEDGIRDLVRSRGLGDVYKRQSADVLKAVYPEYKEERAGPSVPKTREEGWFNLRLSLIHI